MLTGCHWARVGISTRVGSSRLKCTTLRSRVRRIAEQNQRQMEVVQRAIRAGSAGSHALSAWILPEAAGDAEMKQ